MTEGSELTRILKQYIPTCRSQGADGPPTEHEEILHKLYGKISAKGGCELYTPYLWFANGWKQCLELLLPRTSCYWQSIETAPSGEVLAWDQEERKAVQIHLSNPARVTSWQPRFSHWMPMPKGPGEI